MDSALFDTLASSTSLPPIRIPAPTWNATATLKNIPIDSNLAWLLCALCMAMSWVIYITYYNSRVIGYILTRVLNHFIKQGYVKVGSLSISVLSGKIMFRDVAYITEDCTWRAQDGWIIFRWWYPYVRKEISEDLSHSDTRLSMLLNGFELHVYNRSQLYSRLEHLFGLEPSIVPSGLEPYWQDSGGEGDTQTPIEKHDTITVPKYEWRDLIPVIKAEISTGRVVFGNRLLPTTLSVNFEEAHIIYTTKPAPSRLDQFTHITKCKAENFKVILAPSPKYTGLSDEPPRYMGEGFVVFQSNFVDLYYYQDEAGLVTAEPEMVELADGDVVQRSTAPLWGLDIKCGKGTDFSYGPWADRQREHLYKFFFPQDFQTLEVTKQAKVGERRFCESFDIRLSTLAEATIDILFSKEKETNAIHMNVGQGSYLEVTVPMHITEDGYISRINGQLLHLEASTSLQYRSLVESETLEFDVQVKYPRIWNDHQNWTCILTGCKATVHLIYAHKHFFHALMEDWASKSRPDILHFVPYTWHFSLILKEFELITVVNEYNWIDCSSQHQENTYLAVSGDQFELSFDLPFVEYLPPTVALKFWIQGESVDMCMYLPEVNPNRDIILMLERCSKLTCRNGSPVVQDNNSKKWRNMAKTSAGWVDCWSVPIVALSIRYIYHPSPPCCHSGLDLDITTPEKEEILLSPIRPNGSQNRKKRPYSQCLEFDPTSMNPDTVHLELEIGPSVLKLYGSLLRNLMNLKVIFMFSKYMRTKM
ncbi:Uncharacterized protein KIAA1109 [Araneus ventricosus]|uniref:Uncharacterized protein KIAA1109 n=1 Tax=Araneus ventricosus TaxID=182803 RepID=A0A4Y2A6U4_ARAVE|nr:Uncharacterized protein KIAA1109 [Araneus ventricosus]